MIKVSAASHVGNRYQVNEDRIGWNHSNGLYFVADGMGGHVGGEVASELVSQVLLSQSSPVSLLDCIMQAHHQICAAARADASLEGMGSTVVATQIKNDQCELCWVGDSRAYLWRSGNLKQLTEDHSLVQMLLKKGEITPEQARTHKYKNVISQTLGVNTPVPDQRQLRLLPGDWLLLCSDGLTDELSDSEISSILRDASAAETAETALLSEALSKVGRDNISLMILSYPLRSYAKRRWLAAGGVLASACLAWLLLQ